MTARDEGLVATVEHAARCMDRLRLLEAQIHEAMAVAADMAAGASLDAIDEALAVARRHELPRRRDLARIRKSIAVRRIAVAEPGTVVERQRGAWGEPWPDKGTWVVYALYDDADTLLYVGVSSNPAGRMAGHRDKGWTHCRMVLCADRAHAYQLEGDLIFQHQPPLNVAARGRRRFVTA